MYRRLLSSTTALFITSTALLSQHSFATDLAQAEIVQPWANEASYYGGFDERLKSYSYYAQARIGDQVQPAEYLQSAIDSHFKYGNNTLQTLITLFDYYKTWRPGQDFARSQFQPFDYVCLQLWGNEQDQVAFSEAQDNIFVAALGLDNFDDYLLALKDSAEISRQFAEMNNRKFQVACKSLNYGLTERLANQLRNAIPDYYALYADNNPETLEKRTKYKQDILDPLEEELSEQKYLMWDIMRSAVLARWQSIWAQIVDAQHHYLSQNRAEVMELLANGFSLGSKGFERPQDDLTKEWLDLMPAEHYFSQASEATQAKHGFTVLPLQSTQFADLINAINHYHETPKTEEASLTDRVVRLRDIAQLAGGFNHPIAKEIATRAGLKGAYLESLTLLPQMTFKLICSIPQKPGSTVTRLKTDLERDLDPLKRYLLTNFFKWRELRDQNPTTPSFFLWLETQDTRSFQKDERFDFFSKEQKLVRLENGRAFNDLMGDNEGVIKDGRYVYNIDEEDDLYVLPAFETDTEFRKTHPEIFRNHLHMDVLNHDVILGELTLPCAGIVRFENGRITRIDTNSGHYLPKMGRHLRPALAKLLAKHPNSITAETIVGNYDGTVSMRYQDFLVATHDDLKEKADPSKEDIANWRAQARESRALVTFKKHLNRQAK